MSRFEKALLWGLCLSGAILLVMGNFHAACGEVRGSTLRLHVRAESDLPQDQRVKLLVRDAVLELLEQRLQGAQDLEQALQTVESLLPEIERRAALELRQQQSKSGVTAKLVREAFPTRHYGGSSLPAGEYASLVVEIGSGAGQNWWCVLYPGICIGAASSEQALESYSGSARTVVTGYGEYRIGFLLEEIYLQLKEFCSSSAP